MRVRFQILATQVTFEANVVPVSEGGVGAASFAPANLDDIAQAIPGCLDRCQIDALLSDLASDMSGTLQYAFERMAWRVA